MNYRTFVNHLIQKIVILDYGRYPKVFSGYSNNEILTGLEQQGAATAPQLYIEFMKAMGKSTNVIFWSELDFDFEGCSDTKREFQQKLGLYQAVTCTLPIDAFVFAYDYDGNFMFFHTDSVEDDPTICIYEEGRNDFRAGSRFSRIISSFILNSESEEAQQAFLDKYLPKK